MAEALQVVIQSDDDQTKVDPVTGTIETPLPDGGVVVQLDAARPKRADNDDKWTANLAEEINAGELGQIANDMIDAIEADDRSRQGHLSNRARGFDLLGLELKEPRSNVGDSAAGVDGLSSVVNPLLLEAVLKGWANAVGEFLPAAGPCKIRNDGEETQLTSDLADALERDMNHWLTTTASEYYPDTSHMLLWGTYFGGSGFKKVYHCPLRRRPVSESVDEKDLIVSDTTKDLRSCRRITHQIPMPKSVYQRMMLAGAYRDVTLTQPTPVNGVMDNKIAMIQGVNPQRDRPEDQPYTIWETQCELDLPEYAPGKFKDKGIPLPYRVTIDKDSREVLAIIRDWREDDEECERKRMYVRYPYVPGPGFYGTGLLNILGNSSAAMTAAWRLALDNAMFANFPSGMIAKDGARQNSVDMKLGLAQWTPIETGGKPIAQMVMPNPYRDVTAGLMTMIDKVTGQSQALGGVADIPAAEGIQNVPVGTMLAQIEQATKVMAAAHKGMHTAQSEELQLIVDLLREDPESFWRANRVCPPGFWNEEKFNQAIQDCELIPASDPNTPSHIHRVMEALALVQLIALPAFTPHMDAKETLLRCMRAIKADPTGIVIDPPPQAALPDPKMIEAMTKQQKLSVDAQTAAQSNAVKQQELASKEKTATIDLAKEVIIHQHDADKVAHEQAADAQQASHQQAMDVRQHAADVQDAAHSQAMEQQKHGLDVARFGLETQQAFREGSVAQQEADTKTHQALHPPKPAAAKPKAKK